LKHPLFGTEYFPSFSDVESHNRFELDITDLANKVMQNLFLIKNEKQNLKDL